MNLKDDLPAGKHLPDSFTVVVEIPKGSQNKYEYDPELEAFKLDRVLFSPLHYPGDYGFVPQTLATDGDPLDALVLVSFPTFPGAVLEVRPIGMLEFVDSGEADDKILCVPVSDIRYESVTEIHHMQEPVLNEIAHFFMVYKELEGKEVQVKGWQHAKDAKKVVQQAAEAYRQKRG